MTLSSLMPVQNGIRPTSRGFGLVTWTRHSSPSGCPRG
jgi:hypothetical protein